MKNRTSLVLMEQLLMVLVFALAAALCLNIFVKADQISRETARRDEAILMAQNSAQVLKACAGDAEKAAQILSGQVTDTGLAVEAGGFVETVTFETSEIPGLGLARIDIYLEEDLIFTLRTGWQEVGK